MRGNQWVWSVGCENHWMWSVECGSANQWMWEWESEDVECWMWECQSVGHLSVWESTVTLSIAKGPMQISFLLWWLLEVMVVFGADGDGSDVCS